MGSDLYLHQFSLDGLGLVRLAKRLHLPPFAMDLGYLAHAQLAQWFPEAAPKPFCLPSLNRRASPGPREPGAAPPPASVEVLGYSTRSREELLQHAQAFARPEACEELARTAFSSKRMPSRWEVGMRLGFEARVCPVLRRSKPGQSRDGKKLEERDVFLARCEEPGAPPPGSLDRREVYAGWLGQQLQAQGGVRGVACRVESFHLARLTRRTQGAERKAPQLTLPDAVLRGTFEVADEEKFQALLTRGIGRHRSFGFGMLLLRPAER